MKRYLLLLVLLAIPHAHAGEYFGKDLSSWPQTEARKTKNDFAAWLLVTPNLDWQQRWDTPPDTIPHFDEANEVHVGEKLVVLTFFANPGTTANGHSFVKCSLKVTRPDGSLSVPEQLFDCLNGVLQGNPRNIRLSPAAIEFTAEPTDPLGVWVVAVTLEDTVRNVTLCLTTTYKFVGK